MRVRNERQRGFTLIELLIVVAILGILAAVVIPNVGRFLGRGAEEAQDTEYQNLITATGAMMADNEISEIPNVVSANTSPCTTGTQHMDAFPDDSSVAGSADKKTDPDDGVYDANDKDGYLLYAHDITADSGVTDLVNYMTVSSATYCYVAAADSTIIQYDTDGDQCNPTRSADCG